VGPETGLTCTRVSSATTESGTTGLPTLCNPAVSGADDRPSKEREIPFAPPVAFRTRTCTTAPAVDPRELPAEVPEVPSMAQSLVISIPPAAAYASVSPTRRARAFSRICQKVGDEETGARYWLDRWATRAGGRGCRRVNVAERVGDKRGWYSAEEVGRRRLSQLGAKRHEAVNRVDRSERAAFQHEDDRSRWRNRLHTFRFFDRSKQCSNELQSRRRAVIFRQDFDPVDEHLRPLEQSGICDQSACTSAATAYRDQKETSRDSHAPRMRSCTSDHASSDEYPGIESVKSRTLVDGRKLKGRMVDGGCSAQMSSTGASL
jgi:hypothetical protein